MDSSAFFELHPKVQRWVWRTGWAELRTIQEAAIPPILGGERDVVIAAGTASGKTEAAFLPIFSTLVPDSAGSVRALCLSPLRALINDQFQRLDALAEELGVPVHRWHGDVAATQKRKVLDRPEGVLIMTPESLEALFVRRGPVATKVFSRLGFVVVDELHAFLGNERGAQLQVLLHRLELAIRRRVPRIGLSATLGDLGLACEFLRPGKGSEVVRIESSAEGQELKLQLKGFHHLPPKLTAREIQAKEAAGIEVTLEESIDADRLGIGHHLFAKLRGGHHLIFANSRARVEEFSDLLRRLCEGNRVPNEFWPHHGSLSRELREDTEAAIKDRSRPATAICTTTLELGIDVGAIESIAQIGCPPSVASLRQRLGRSGRSGGPSVLRAYVQEQVITRDTRPHATLRSELVETIAMIELLLAGWCEPPDLRGLHLSTLVQQVLALIAQYGAVRADQAFRSLSDAGPFANLDAKLFATFLRSLAKSGLLQQDHSGELVLGAAGERLVNHYSFYASFTSPEEYRLLTGGRVLGSLPISFSLFPGLHLIFAGRRWLVASVDEEHKTIDLKPAAGGRPPMFPDRGMSPVHDQVRKEMARIYSDTAIPRYLDATARDLLDEGRQNFRRLGLADGSIVEAGDQTLLFLWRGDRVLDTLVLWLAKRNLTACREGVALVFTGVEPSKLSDELRRMDSGPVPDPIDLALEVRNKRREKFHFALSDELLAADYAAGVLDLSGAVETLNDLFVC